MELSLKQPDLTSLYRRRVFSSTRAVDSHAQVAQAFADHRLRWGAGKVDSELFQVKGQRLSAFILRYGPEVAVEAQPVLGSTLIQMPLRGRLQVQSDGGEVIVGPGEGAVISSRRSLKLCWGRDCEQLIVQIPNDVFHDAARGLPERQRPPAGAHGLRASVSVLQGDAGRCWQDQVRSVLGLIGHSGVGRWNPAWLQHLEVGLALFLLTQDRSEAPPQQEGRYLSCEPDDARLAELKAYVREHLGAQLQLEDLARRIGMAPRALHALCRRTLGLGPMAWVREIRLQAAREQLEANAGRSVAQVAWACGFSHPGRFSAYYRHRFGTSPSEIAHRELYRRSM